MPPRRTSTPEPESIVDETEESLDEAARRTFEDMIQEETFPTEPIGEPMPLPTDEKSDNKEYRPGIGDMVTVRGGGLYLPVRRRVGWMRGFPEPHPDWTIDTICEQIDKGVFKAGKVEGGYARYRANLYDETGRLISTGTKTEYSERFMDFAEKAETGSIGRCLAVAGYGTEAAVDLDEGLDQERIADAPVMPSRPINITTSEVPGIRPGGRPQHVTKTQISEIGRLNKAVGLGLGLVTLMESIKGERVPELEPGKEQQQLLEFLETFTNDQAGDLIQQLTKVLKEQQESAGVE